VPSSVTHCRCPVTELDGHSQVRSTAGRPSLYPPTPSWRTKWDKASRPSMRCSPTTAPETRPMGTTRDTWPVSTRMPLAHVPPRDGTLTELANFDNDERNVIHERGVTPRTHPAKNCLPHFRQFMFCRLDAHRRKPFDPEHLFLIIKGLDEPVRVENQAIARFELNFVHGLGWCGFREAAEDPVLRLK